MPYRPHINGAVKETNKNIKKIIRKIVVTYKNLYEMLSYALYAYQIIVRISIGITSYF